MDNLDATVHVNLRTPLGLALYRYGHDDPDISMARALLSPGDMFVDGGANVGLFTLAAASKVGPHGTVLAFEPAKATSSILRRNIELNRFVWVELFRQALGDQPDTLDFVSFEESMAGHSSFAPPTGILGGSVESVAVTTLDIALANRDLSRLKLIKLDIEGAEVKCIRGAATVIRSGRPDLIVEMAPENLERQGSTRGELLEELQSAGYSLFRIAADGVAPAVVPLSTSNWSLSPNVFATARLSEVEARGIRILST